MEFGAGCVVFGYYGTTVPSLPANASPANWPRCGTRLEIRDGRLYREPHGTFEVYCRERWGWSRIHAHRQIEAAKVAKVLPMGNTPPNERVARELAPLADEPSLVHRGAIVEVDRPVG